MTDLRKTEAKWQKRWREGGVYEVDLPTGPKMFVTAAYPYPNGLMHLGHLGTYLPADFTARYYRMKGYEVLFPMGFHVTGPAATGFARAIQRGDGDVVEEYHEVHRVSLEDIEGFKDPERIVEYFTEKIRADFENIGLSIDWRRSFMTKDKPYTRFIEWQFSKLDAAGHLVKGSHPVIWCESCGNAVGEADRLEGEEVDIVEFFVIKFTLEDGTVLPAATLRPETVFGVTNMWLKPGGEYKLVRVQDEKWIVGRETVDKLRRQKEVVTEIGDVDPSEYFGGYCRNPVNGAKVPIYPARFVDTANATGVVMSVPAHAPVDYQALEDLKSEPLPPTVEISEVESIDPIALIEVEGLSRWPAVEIVKRMKITSQDDVEELEKATQAIYKKEFYEGVLGPITGKYAGRTVSEAKDVLSRDFMCQGIVDVIYETTGQVICRCRNPCEVKVVSDQWFIDYGDREWKSTTKRMLDQMRVIPEKLRTSFEYYIDWMREKPCTRRIGFGTPLPRDPDWIIEPLSDSTVYMAYYTAARIINQEGVEEKSLVPAVFDYVFLGQGDADSVAAEAGILVATLERMREEFTRWYPNDIRFVGPDLVGNHATFFMFNHGALLPPELWPRGIAVSGIVLSEGQKMSKSKGNSIPITDSLEEWGADIVRLWFAACAEFGQDINYEATLRNSVAKRLMWFDERIADLAQEPKPRGGRGRLIDIWLDHRMARRAKLVEEHIERVSSRKAIQELMFETYNDIQYYLRRAGDDPDRSVLARTYDSWIRMMTPFAPHFCEEMWERLGREPFVVTEKWPELEINESGPAAELAERLLRNTIEDVKKIISATSASYTTLNLYTAEDWKRTTFKGLAWAAMEGSSVSEAISSAMKDPEVRSHGKAAASYIKEVFTDLSRRPEQELRLLAETEIDEYEVLKGASDFVGSETQMEVHVQRADEPERDPSKKAPRAMPMRPAIYLE